MSDRPKLDQNQFIEGEDETGRLLRCHYAAFSVSRRFYSADVCRLSLRSTAPASESKMAAGAAALQMLQTFASFRHKDASRGSAHFLRDVTRFRPVGFRAQEKQAAGTSPAS